MKIIIREGSAAKNFDALIDLLHDFPEQIMFCSDDKHPDSLVAGHINSLCARAIEKGYDVFHILRAACVNPVQHYKLDVGLLNVGDDADFVLVDNLKEVEMQIPPPMEHYIDSMMMDLINNPTKEKLVGGGFFKKNLDSASHRVVSMLENASHIGWRESLNGYIKWQNEHCTNSIKTVKAPIIAINSDWEPTNVEAFRKYAPTFKANIVEGVGHLIMWDNAEEFNKLLEESIQEFIREQWRI